MNPIDCLQSPEKRGNRQIEKESLVLGFLKQELYSTPEILGEVLRLKSRQATWKTLKQLEKKQIIRAHQVSTLGRGRFTLYGITPHGQGMAFDPEKETVQRSYFEASKISELTLCHSLDIQKLRVRAEAVGWTRWVNGDRIGTVLNHQKRPDAIAMNPEGFLTAVECERTLKTLKRYEVSLSSYLQALKRGDYSQIIWACPTANIAKRLKAMVLGIKTIVVAGQRLRIEPIRHHQQLLFCDYDSFVRLGAGKRRELKAESVPCVNAEQVL